MKIFIKLLFVIIYLMAGCLISTAREYFKVIDSRVGLPDNTVTNIVQDTKGYIWLGTSNGLSRYDGITFTTFRHDPDHDNSLSSSFVNSLAVSQAGIFAGTNSGLDLYSFAHGNFVHCSIKKKRSCSRITQTILSVINVGGKILYTDATGGLYTNTFANVTTFTRISHGFNAYALCKYNNDMLLAACADGLRLLTTKGQVMAFHPYSSGPLEKLNVSYIPSTHTAYVGYGLGFASIAFTINYHSITRSATYSPKNLTCAIPFRGGEHYIRY